MVVLWDGFEVMYFLCGVVEGKVLVMFVYLILINVDVWMFVVCCLFVMKFDDVLFEFMGRCKGVVAKTGDDFVWEEYEFGDGLVLIYKYIEGVFLNFN